MQSSRSVDKRPLFIGLIVVAIGITVVLFEYNAAINFSGVTPCSPTNSSITAQTYLVGLQLHYQACGNDGNPYFKWDFGDGQVATAMEGVHNYTFPGSYTIKLYHPDSVIIYQVTINVVGWPFFYGYLVMIAGAVMAACFVISFARAGYPRPPKASPMDIKTRRSVFRIFLGLAFFLEGLIVLLAVFFSPLMLSVDYVILALPFLTRLLVRKHCDYCKGRLPYETQIGDHCPHCGAVFGSERVKFRY